MIIVSVLVLVSVDNQVDFLNIAKPLIEFSHQEAGNIEYGLYEDISKENILCFIEKWQDENALKTHENTEFVRSSISKLKAISKTIERHILKNAVDG